MKCEVRVSSCSALDLFGQKKWKIHKVQQSWMTRSRGLTMMPVTLECSGHPLWQGGELQEVSAESPNLWEEGHR